MIIDSPSELGIVVEKMLSYAAERKKILLIGEIGAGKTTFTQAFCKHFEVEEKVTSPTFSLINEYTYQDAEKQKEAFIYHLDLYRLNTIEEAIDIGIEDILYGPSYCLIEWPALIEPILPEEVVKISIEILENSRRKIIFL